MKRLVLVAAMLAGLIVPVAQAAPSMSINTVTSPAGTYVEGGATTWNVSLFGINAWTYTSCDSTATYSDGETVDGDDANPNGPAGKWSFTTETPNGWEGELDTFVPLSKITASCKLTRSVYLGRRAIWPRRTASKAGPATASRQPNGCSIYSYYDGELTIDCRHSRSWGGATWMFGVGWDDIGVRSTLSFDPSQSTMGAHPVTSRRTFGRMYVTERVSPGTMITVTDVSVSYRRLAWKKIYRHDSKTLHAAWSA